MNRKTLHRFRLGFLFLTLGLAVGLAAAIPTWGLVAALLLGLVMGSLLYDLFREPAVHP